MYEDGFVDEDGVGAGEEKRFGGEGDEMDGFVDGDCFGDGFGRVFFEVVEGDECVGERGGGGIG